MFIKEKYQGKYPRTQYKYLITPSIAIHYCEL